MMLSIASFIFVFLIVALVHEIGHLVFARMAGIRVLEFGVGFGPKIYSKKVKNTIYSVNLFPIIAFVRLAGIDDTQEDEKDCPPEEMYANKKPTNKLIAIASGPIMNVLAGFVIFSLLFIFTGIPFVTNRVETVNKNSAAQKMGLLPGDVIKGIPGNKALSIEQIISKIHASKNSKVTFLIQRGNKEITLSGKPVYDQKVKASILGFSLASETKHPNILQSVSEGFTRTIAIFTMVISLLFQLLIGKVSIGDLAGPIGIAQISGQSAAKGIIPLLYLTGFISINLGAVNLLPIPALDGGRLVFVLIEYLRGKPVNEKIENFFHQWGLILLLGLIFFVSINDVIRIVGLKR